MDNGELCALCYLNVAQLTSRTEDNTANMGKRSRALVWRLALFCGVGLIACGGEQTPDGLQQVPRNRTLIVDCAENNTCGGQNPRLQYLQPLCAGRDLADRLSVPLRTALLLQWLQGRRRTAAVDRHRAPVQRGLHRSRGGYTPRRGVERRAAVDGARLCLYGQYAQRIRAAIWCSRPIWRLGSKRQWPSTA